MTVVVIVKLLDGVWENASDAEWIRRSRSALVTGLFLW